MAYSAPSLPEAARKWQRDALPRIQILARALGIDAAPPTSDSGKWIENGNRQGLFYYKGERDTVKFCPVRTAKIRRKMGEIRQAGEQKSELAVVDEAGPSDFDTTETLSWSRGTQREIAETKSETYGWGITLYQGWEAGGEAQGGKALGGIEISASGEYSKERATSSGEEWGVEHSTEVAIPKGCVARLMQTVKTGPAEQDVEDRIVLELGWRYADWKHRRNKYLNGHVGYAPKGKSKSRWHWDCLDTGDLSSAMLAGGVANPRYPGIPSTGMPLSPKEREALEWLLKEENRTVVVKSTVTYKVGIWGASRVIQVDESGKEKEVELKP